MGSKELSMQLSRLLILLVAQVAHSCYEKDDISIHSPNDVPLVSESDQVELFFLRAELFKAAKWTHSSPLLGALNGYHSGIGFQTANGTTWQVEYDADDFLGAVFPKVADGEVKWTNDAEVCLTAYIRDTYWSSGVSLATVSGATYNELAQTIGQYISNHSGYQAFTPLDATGNDIFVGADTCTDFTHAMLMQLESMGVSLKPVIPTLSSQLSRFKNSSIPPERVHVGLMHPINTVEVLEFYSRMRAVIDAQSWSGRLLDIVLLGLELEAKVFFVLDTSDASHRSYFKYSLNGTKPMSIDLVDLRR